MKTILNPYFIELDYEFFNNRLHHENRLYRGIDNFGVGPALIPCESFGETQSVIIALIPHLSRVMFIFGAAACATFTRDLATYTRSLHALPFLCPVYTIKRTSSKHQETIKQMYSKYTCTTRALIG